MVHSFAVRGVPVDDEMILAVCTEIIRNKDFVEKFGEIKGDKHKRVPKEFADLVDKHLQLSLYRCVNLSDMIPNLYQLRNFHYHGIHNSIVLRQAGFFQYSRERILKR